jgi:hypothetical protein
MLQLHDRTRYRICLAGFAILCVLPTLVIGGWCVGRRLPGCARAEAERLGQQLGITVKLGGLKHVRPGVMLYEGLELGDPETGQTVLRCRLLEITQDSADGQPEQPGQPRTVLTVKAAQPEVEAASLHRVWQCLQRILEGSCGKLDADLRLAAAEVTLRAADGSQTMTNVEAAIETLPAGTRAEVHFRLAGVETPEPIGIRLVRNRQVSPPASGFELYTGGGELPCNVLAMGLEELKPLGTRCCFRGYIWANEATDGWEGEVTGQLVNLDLGRLVTDHFPHKLTGNGQLTIQSARFRHGRLEEGNAMMTAGPGTIDRSLLAAAADRLNLVVGKEPSLDGNSIPYEELALSATFDAKGIRLGGRCKAGKPGTILSDGRDGLLGEPSQPQSVASLVQTLVPQSAVQVPASRQTDWLLHHLPVPEVMPRPGDEAIPPQAWLRLKEPMR